MTTKIKTKNGRLGWALGLLMAVVALGALGFGVIGQNALAVGGPGDFGQSAQLPIAYNNSNYVDTSATCDDGPYTSGEVWHFVVTGTDNFVSLTATFNYVTVVNAVVPSTGGNPYKHAYVLAPGGQPLTAVSAVVDPAGATFVLSHICPGKVNPSVTTTLHLGAGGAAGAHTTLAVGGSVAFGTTVHDSATVSGPNGTPTGTVTFNFYNTATCTGTPVSTSGAVTLDASGVAHPSQDATALAAGDYGFLAHYNGDSKYNAIDDDQCENFHVRATPSGSISVLKTAAGTYERHCTWDITKSVDTASVVLGPDGEATLTYDVDWTKSCVDSNFVVAGTITVSNSSALPDSFEITAVTDSLAGAVVDCNGATAGNGIPFTLAAGTQKVCSYSATAGSAAAGTNNASATADGVIIGAPPVNYTFTLTADTGETATLNDALLGIVDMPVSDSGSLTTGNTHKVTHAGTCARTTVTNTATIAWTGGSDSATASTTVDRLCLDVTKTATGSYNRSCSWNVDKAVVGDDTKVVLPGGSASFDYSVTVDFLGCENTNYAVAGTITVNNTGSVAVTVDVTDALSDPNGTCVVVGGTGASIAAGTSKDFAYSCSFSPDSAAGGTNTASAIATAGGASVTDTGDHAYSFGAPAKVTNGCVDLEGTLAEDPTVTLCETSYTGPTSVPYTFSHTWTSTAESCSAQSFDNAVRILGDGGVGIVRDRAAVTLEKLCLTISKLADLDYTRACTPDVTKEADVQSITLGEGQTGTIHWTVAATLDCANSAGVVSGTVTVTNTGSAAAALGVTDTLATVSCPDSSLDPGQTVVCTYSAAHAIAGGTNSATATLSAGGAEASKTATDDFEVNLKPQGCYVVTDTNSANTFSLCDDGTVTHLADGFNYNQTVGPFTLGCTERTVDNTAIVTHGGTEVDRATDSVIIRVPCIHGFTVGFWGNQNGEARLLAMGNPNVTLLWKAAARTVSVAVGQLILPNSSNFCGLGNLDGVAVSCTKTTLDSGVNANSVNNLAQQTLALTYNSLYRGPAFSNQTLGFMGCTVGAGLTPTLSSASKISDALAYANYVLGNVSSGGVAITQTQVGAVNALLGQCLNLEN